MSSRLEVQVKPQQELSDATRAQQRLKAHLTYEQEVPDPAADPGAKPKPLRAITVVAVELDPNGKAVLRAEDGAAESIATLSIESPQGVRLFQSETKFAGENKSVQATVTVPVDIYRATGKRSLPQESRTVRRSGRFTRFDSAVPDFRLYRLFVALVRPAVLPDAAANPQTPAVRRLLGIEGEGDLSEFEVTQIEGRSADAASANALALRDCVLLADGSFQFAFDVENDEVGWFWLLLGPVSYAGYQRDPLRALSSRQALIILPPLKSGEGSPGAGADAATGSCAGCASSPPMDFDERQLLDNARAFNDDPGTACAPFSNPQRLLGERPFFTVLRVDQPELGAEGSLKTSRPIILDLAPPVRASAIATSFAAEADDGQRNLAPGPALNLSRLARSRRVATVAEAAAQPAAEVRSLINVVSKPIDSFWRNWVLTRKHERGPVTPRNPIEWEGDPTLYQAGSVAGGHILEFRVQWRSNGYSLGNVAHTLTLAPRQTRRISKVSWRRRERAVRQEATASQDQVAQSTLRDRSYSDAVESSLSEWSKGGSESSTTGVAGGIGFAMGPVVIGGGAAHGQASSESWQSGGRRVAANEQQSLRDAIRQYGDSLRRFQSTVVTEVTQEEDVEGVSETVRNVNYCHALTVVYHEILRHHRVDTAFAGVRECLFVPFSVTPFDIVKALKWRDKLRPGMLARNLRWALDRLDEVATAWVDSDIPPGRRSAHPIKYLTGSAYIQLSIERPRDRATDEAAEDYRQLWSPFAPLLGESLSSILKQLERTDRDREVYFQREIAPTMAAKWADRLTLSVAGAPLGDADFTLATSYRFGGTVRVDFTIPVDGRFNRENLQTVTFAAPDSLPIGSVANLVRVQFDYFTDHFEAKVQSKSKVNDLIKPDTGQPDPLGAVTYFPLTPWERQDLRRVIEDAVDQLIVHLNANLVYYHKVIFWLLDRDELYMLLDGFTAPYGRRYENGRWVEDTGRSLASVVEREPLGILGNALVFRVSAGVFLGVDGHESPDALHTYYHDSNARPQPLRVSLPTDGLYAQAIMDNCEACEEHLGGTDWVLADKDPELESLVDQLGSRRAEPSGLTPSQLPATLINLQNAPAAPDPAGLAGILQAVTKSDSFRDMAGLAGTQANALGALTQAASLAQSFGQMAVDLQKAKQGTQDAKQKLSNIEKARSAGLIDEGEATRQTAKALEAQNMTSTPDSLTTDVPISNALQRAGAAGQPIEVSRQNQFGSELVRVGSAPRDPNLVLAGYSSDLDSKKDAEKLPAQIGGQAAQAWEGVAPIPPRNPAACPAGSKNLGTLLCVHDAETKIDMRDYAARSDADAWVLVHTVSDLIEAIRKRVGTCDYLQGIHIEAHGGWRGQGGFRLGDDTDKDGHVEPTEAQDFVSNAAQAAKFGAIIKNALAPGRSFVSVAACGSAGTSEAFLKTLQGATGGIVIGTPEGCSSGGNWFSGAWWEADKGRVQINADGTTKTDPRDDGKGIWKPF